MASHPRQEEWNEQTPRAGIALGAAALVAPFGSSLNNRAEPFEQPTRYSPAINLKTKALGLTMPQSLLLRVDELIQ
jgi:hypothetical protein